MNLGNLDRKIDIEQFALSQSTSGATSKTWSLVKSVWAKVIYKGGGEPVEADQEQGYNMVEFTIRYCNMLSGGTSPVNEKQRIKYDGEYFDILYINIIGRNNYQKIVAKRKTVYQEQ